MEDLYKWKEKKEKKIQKLQRYKTCSSLEKSQSTCSSPILIQSQGLLLKEESLLITKVALVLAQRTLKWVLFLFMKNFTSAGIILLINFVRKGLGKDLRADRIQYASLRTTSHQCQRLLKKGRGCPLLEKNWIILNPKGILVFPKAPEYVLPPNL